MSLKTDLRGELALITGCTGGIGRATALTLARLNCNIAIHYNSAADAAAALAQQIRSFPNNVTAHAFQADLSSYDAARRLHRDVTATQGHPTILILNAGATLGKSGVADIADISVADLEATHRINTFTPYLLAQLCLPHLLSHSPPWGRIIFISSVAAFTGGLVGPHYAASKAALHGLIHWLAATYAKSGVTVNGIAPALIQDTKMLPGDPGTLAQKIPVGRLGRPEEIASTVEWIVRTSYVNNKVIAVDGGMYVQ